ncbi:MAG: aromatic amino acid lyase, partial [Corynebacterium sp.]|nr:aromatic amino acid lyase [Corynebacterium sp.]
MHRITITDLLNGLERNRPFQFENLARARIIHERNLINDFLDAGGHAYGFSTFFGHLDVHAIRPEDSLDLLKAHLVGSPTPLSDSQSRAITLIKLCQLGQGGSGLSPETFDVVLSAVNTEISIDLDASYGSGDVVPGAWWVRSVLGEFPDLERGDLIALINGSFIPEGLLLSAVNPLNTAFSAIRRSAGKAQEFLQKRVDQGVQLPVSLRDIAPLEKELSDGLGQLMWSIEESANRQSFNPTFTFEGPEGANGETTVSVVSNSSFLNFECLAAVRR